MLDNIKEYLSALDIPSEQKRYSMSFCKKLKYLDDIHAIASKETNEYVASGYGNVNSKICFVFKDIDSYKSMKSLIQDILDKFNINSWNIYITFINKTKSEYNKKYSFLANEIYAVGPKLLYIFNEDDDVYSNIIKAFNDRNIPLPEKHFLINVDSSDYKNAFKYLINYREMEEK